MGLDKSFRLSNSSFKNTQLAFRNVNRLLKLYPSNSYLLAQKQKLLQNAAKDTIDKLETLKDADKQARFNFKKESFVKINKKPFNVKLLRQRQN